MKTRVFENMNDLKNNRRGGHIKNNDISFVKENNSIIIGDNNVSNSILYPPILTTKVEKDQEGCTQFTEDIILLIQQENNLEEILKYCLIGFDMFGEAIPMEVMIPCKLSKNITFVSSTLDYENYYYLIPVGTAEDGGTPSLIRISKQFPYKLKIIN